MREGSFSRAVIRPIIIAMLLPVAPGAADVALPGQFTAVPGTNTLLAARDAVRAWRAAGHAGQPASIVLVPGEYALTKPLALGARDSNVSWVARDGGQALITGGKRISGWAAGNDGLWHAQTGLHFEQLYVNGQRATRARFPIAGYFQIQAVREEKASGGKARLTVQVAPSVADYLKQPPATFRDAQLLVFYNWDTSRYRITAVDPAAATLSVVGEPMSPVNPWNAQSRFILDNCTGGWWLPPGAWLLDDHGKLSYHPRRGEFMGATAFIAPALDRLLEVDGANDVHFAGLQFGHTRYELPPDGCPASQAASAQMAALEIDHARDVTFQNCEIEHTGAYGLWFQKGCHAGRVEACLLEDLGAGGIRIGPMDVPEERDQTDGTVIDNNIIRHCGRIHPSAVGIWIGHSANNRVTHNDISDLFYTGISVGWTWGYGPSPATNNFIGFNRLHQIGQGVLSDLGGIYTLGVSPGSAAIGNVIFDVRAHDYGGWGIYLDEGSSDWRVESNLVWHCTCLTPPSGGAFQQHYGATNLIANNIFALSSGPPIQATKAEMHRSFTLEQNLIVSSNAEFFTGPWDRLHYDSRSNCFVVIGTPLPREFPNGTLARWQQAGHEQGSIFTNCTFVGTWPDVQLPLNSPAYSVGFKMFAPETAGVYGSLAWRRAALERQVTAGAQPITPE